GKFTTDPNDPNDTGVYVDVTGASGTQRVSHVDVVATTTPGVYKVTIKWLQLVDLGLNDGLPSPTRKSYPITVSGTNADGLSTAVNSSVKILDVAPAITVTGSHTTTVGAPLTIGFTANDQSPLDIPITWTVNWGDGTIETFGQNTTQATHTYTSP